MASQRSLLLTGATGFVGGTILAQLLQHSKESSNALSITALVRKQSQADVLKGKGVNTAVLEGGLDDAPGLVNLASQHDIVLHAATGFHTSSAEALITGLGTRKKNTGVAGVYIHLSGTTNLSVGTVTGSGGESLKFSDRDEGIYEYEVKREALQAYSQRTTDVRVIETGEKQGIRTYIIMPPLVYGRGTGYFNQRSQQIPMLIRNAIKAARAEYIAPGTARIGHVHVTDLAALFGTVLSRALTDDKLPAGRSGYFFAENGTHTWAEVAASIAKTGGALGALGSAEPSSIGLSEAALKFWGGDEAHTERILASSSSTRAERGYELGWRPSKTDEDWQSNIDEEFPAILNERPA